MQGVHLRKYGVEATINFTLFEVDGVDFRVDAVDSGANCTIMKDQGAEGTCSNDFVDEGTGYSLTLTATEMQAAQITVYIIDAATKVWLDEVIQIETYGHASAMHAMDFDEADGSQFVEAGGTGDQLTAIPATVDWLNGGRLDLILDALVAKFAGITLLSEWLGAMAGKQASDATAQTEMRASGAGSGTYDATADSQEAQRDHVGDGTNLTEAGGDGDHLTEAGGTGDHLTAINLPNQTMDIIGSITGNLSGSVGSVSGHTNQTGDTFAKLAGITLLAEWLGLIAGKQAGDATALTEIKATGAGSGTYDPTTDSNEALEADHVALQADTDDIQTRLPAALVGGAMDSDVSAMQAAIIAAATFAAGALDAAALATDAVNEIRDAILPTQNVAMNNIPFVFRAASDHITPVTGATGTAVTRSIDGGAFGAGTGTINEVANGMYSYDASQADMNGGIIMFRFTASGGTPGAADDSFVSIITGGGV